MQRWPNVWAVRLSHLANHPQCRSQFRASFRSNRKYLQDFLPPQLFELIESVLSSDDATVYQNLAPHLERFALAVYESEEHNSRG